MRERGMKARKEGGHVYYHYIYSISVWWDGEEEKRGSEDAGKGRKEGGGRDANADRCRKAKAKKRGMGQKKKKRDK